MMRWWPPLLHLLLVVVLVPLAVLRIGAALESGPVALEQHRASGEEAVSEGGQVLPVRADVPVDLAALTSRPLFVPGRQGEGVGIPAEVPEETPDPAPVLRMVGYLDDGTKPRAILVLEGSGAEAIVREGEAFAGFEVRQITRDAVIVINEGEETTVKMFGQ